MHIKEVIQSRRFTIALVILAELILLALVFQAGMFVGFRKARFSYSWGENYHRMFGGPRQGFMEDFVGQDFIDSHGTAGRIVKIDNNALIIKGQNEVEKIIITTPTTSIKQGPVDIALKDLRLDDQVVVIGSPQNEGQIEAKIIRIFPPKADAQKFTRPAPPFNFPPTKY